MAASSWMRDAPPHRVTNVQGNEASVFNVTQFHADSRSGIFSSSEEVRRALAAPPPRPGWRLLRAGPGAAVRLRAARLAGGAMLATEAPQHPLRAPFIRIEVARVHVLLSMPHAITIIVYVSVSQDATRSANRPAGAARLCGEVWAAGAR